MAESPLDRLKRLAVEKKAAVVPVAQPVANAEAASGEAGASEQLKETEALVTKLEEGVKEVKETYGEVDTKLAILSMQIAAADKQVKEELAKQTVASKQEEDKGLGNSVTTSEPSGLSAHPLAMEFAELEAALLASDPEFKTILRKIHRHLGQEAELVTQMTEQEIQMVVQGLIVFANAEVVAPAAAKTAKTKIAAAKKQIINADDL